MNEIRHRSRTGTTRGHLVMPTDDVADDPAYQQTILRLGLHGVGTINARDIDRVQYVTQVAAAIRRRRSA